MGIKVIEVPPPILEKGNVLVEVSYSFISSGTEMATLKEMEPKGFSDNLIQSKERLKKLVKFFNEKGIKKTISIISQRITADGTTSNRLVPLGYCCSGTIVAIGEGVSMFSLGDKVACAGAGKATHSELVLVSENLCVKIPTGCDMKSASSVAVGSIAMNGVRNSEARMGEFVCVIGLGLVGLIVCRLLKISGCRIIGFDIDPVRVITNVRQAKDIGVDEAFSNHGKFISIINLLTKNMGVDKSIITAASRSKSIITTVMEITRKRGRVVAVGFIPMDIDENPFMKKEIEFIGSTSYGPGRYDARYEEKNMDYPYAFVRWTEKRNMAEYLRLIAEKHIDLFSFLDNKAFPVKSAKNAYKILKEGNSESVGFFIEYISDTTLNDKLKTKVDVGTEYKTKKINIGIIGAGSFIKEMYFPNLKRINDIVHIQAIVNKRGHNAIQIAKEQNANYASTSIDDILNDNNIDAVIIATRHNTHADLALSALESGKHVLLEKPLALNFEELEKIRKYFSHKSSGNFPPLLLTGFNRRFSPHILNLKNNISNRVNPLIINYQINTKPLDYNHWEKTEEGGGRNLGEACHIYDLFTFLTGGKATSINAKSVSVNEGTFDKNENFIATIKFDDGSICNLTYTCIGTSQYPKEIATIYCDGTVYQLNDYLKFDAIGVNSFNLVLPQKDKGHYKELTSFFDAIKNNKNWPIPLWQQIQATEIALEVEKQINGQ